MKPITYFQEQKFPELKAFRERMRENQEEMAAKMEEIRKDLLRRRDELK
jgi:hypothetical protein